MDRAMNLKEKRNNQYMRHGTLLRTGRYTLFLLTITSALIAQGQNNLVNGVASQDSLSSSTQVKSWSFSANAGDHMTLTMTKLTGGAAFNPRLEVISPSGFSQGVDTGTVAARLDLQ